MKSEKSAPANKTLKIKNIIPENRKQNLNLKIRLFLCQLMKVYIKEKIDKIPTMSNKP